MCCIPGVTDVTLLVQQQQQRRLLLLITSLLLLLLLQPPPPLLLLLLLLMILLLLLIIQECAVGYKRSGGGFYLGTCDRCNCHGHADECGQIDGLCIVGFVLLSQVVQKQTLGEVGTWSAIWWPIMSGIFLPKIIEILWYFSMSWLIVSRMFFETRYTCTANTNTTWKILLLFF